MNVSIIGAGGLTGKELISLLVHHPDFEIVHTTSNKSAGSNLSDTGVRYRKDLVFHKHEDPIPKDSLVVLAVPNEVSLELTPKLLEKGHKLIDLSGAYRLHDKEIFGKFYGLTHSSFDLMKQVVFGIPEIFRDRIKNANFVSNPGCYATSVITPLFTLSELRQNISGNVIVNSASGVSGAGGRTEDIGFTFTNTYENFRAYKVLSHQHQPEMEEYAFTGASTNRSKIIFIPHLLPAYRGILSTFVIHFDRPLEKQDFDGIRQKFRNEPFIRFYDNPEEIELKKVQNTNFVDISFRFSSDVLVMISALDNLVKGAAGQALQNMNLMCGFDERKGLIPV
ncbi:MAG: N-acetyl-gamma-glutamyl-phosphate reductase [Leptospira sp.]|nr:N-acetyl-gamma-glutamyl-phosphate reductase [Leptospira sp.]